MPYSPLSDPTAPPIDWVPAADVAHASNELPFTCRAMRRAYDVAGGVAVVLTAGGVERSIPIAPGEVWPVGIVAVRIAGSTLTGLWLAKG